MKKQYRTLLSSIIICLLSGLILSSCTTEYTRDDIEKYAEKITEHKCLVSKTYTSFKGEDGYSDRIWKVKDKQENLEFYVIDDYAWGMESLNNNLKNNYYDAFILKNRYVFSPLKKVKIKISKDNWNIEKPVFEGEYTNANDLKAIYADLKKSQILLQSFKNENLSLNFEIKFNNKLKQNYPKDNTSGNFNLSSKYMPSFDNMINNYITTVLAYRYSELYSDFTDVEKEKAIDSCEYRVYIEKDSSKTLYDDIIPIDEKSISFGSLYDILKSENFEVSGEYNKFSFNGTDGCKYEFSYDFLDYTLMDNSNFDNSTIDNYNAENAILSFYYSKDGEQILSDDPSYPNVNLNDIESMTGIKLSIE